MLRLPLFRGLATRQMLLLVWLPIAMIGSLHYATGAHHHWVHDLLRRLYYVPILIAAFSNGVPGGAIAAVVVSLTYAPHAFLTHPMAQDPATDLNKLLEIVLYNTIGILSGVLADRESARRRQAEQAFVQQQRMAEQLVRAGRLAALGELVAGIAHEIKNPLHTLRGTAEIVDEIIPKNAEQAPMWTLLRQEIDRLLTISERFLSFARPSPPLLELLTVATVYERVAELARVQVRSHAGVRFDVQPLAASLAATEVMADRDQITQIFLNLGSNALRAVGDSGRITLRAAPRDDDQPAGPRFVCIEIENDGPPIPESQLEHIFDPFVTHAADGTGLGLAIAERIAEAHGGFLEARNQGMGNGGGGGGGGGDGEGGGGVVFRLALPHHDAEGSPAKRRKT